MCSLQCHFAPDIFVLSLFLSDPPRPKRPRFRLTHSKSHQNGLKGAEVHVLRYMIETRHGRDGAAEKSEHSFKDIVPYGKWLVNVLLGQIQANVGKVVLPLLRLLRVPNTETEPPGNTHKGFGKEVGVALQFDRLDLRVARLVDCPPAVNDVKGDDH